MRDCLKRVYISIQDISMSRRDAMLEYDIKIELDKLDDAKKEDNRNEDFKNCIDIADKELIYKTVKNKDVEKEWRYACVGCNFRSHDKLPISGLLDILNVNV